MTIQTQRASHRSPEQTQVVPVAGADTAFVVDPAAESSEVPHIVPSRTGSHAPNLATLDQLRSRGRNPLLSVASRRPASAVKGCSSR